jgi:hypothetical protein
MFRFRSLYDYCCHKTHWCMALTSIYRSLTINTVSDHFSYTCTNHHITFNTTIHGTTTRQIDRFRSHGFGYRNTAETKTHGIVTSEHRLYWHAVLPVHWTLLMLHTNSYPRLSFTQQSTTCGGWQLLGIPASSALSRTY